MCCAGLGRQKTGVKCAYEICVIQPINGTMLVDAGTDADGADNLDGDGVLFYPGVAGPLSSIRLVRPTPAHAHSDHRPSAPSLLAVLSPKRTAVVLAGYGAS